MGAALVEHAVNPHLGARHFVKHEVAPAREETKPEAREALVPGHRPALGERAEAIDSIEQIVDRALGRGRRIAAKISGNFRQIALRAADDPDDVLHAARRRGFAVGRGPAFASAPSRLRIVAELTPRSPAWMSASASSSKR